MSSALLALAVVLQTPASLAPGLTTRSIVLTYHDMVPKRDRRSLWFDCTPQELSAQLDWLAARGATFVSLDRLYRHLTTGRGLPDKAVAITFADNYRGFYLYAWPILRKRRIPVTMFVHTDHVGSTRGRPKMTWAQLRELDREGLVTIASQTRSHPADLRTLSDAVLKEEFVGSRRALERELAHPIAYLAYPNGKYDLRVSRAAAAAGYRMAFTEAQRPAELAPDRFRVPRYVHTLYAKAWTEARTGRFRTRS